VAPLAALALPAPAPVAIEAFAAPPRLTAVNISPDGRYLAVITTAADRDTVVILERSQPNLPPRPVLTAPEFFTLDYCRFATPTRLVCSLRGPGMYQGIAIPTSRLIAVDADGTHQQVIAPIEGAARGAYQDHVIGWTAEVPDTILVVAQRNPVRFDMPSAVRGVRQSHMGSTVVVNPSVFGLNIRNGNLTERLPPRRPLSNFLVDAAGRVRLGWGMNDGSRELHYEVHEPLTDQWRALQSIDTRTSQEVLKPIALCAAAEACVWAIGPAAGRQGLWRMELGTGSRKVEFAPADVDLAGPMFGPGGDLLGVVYETDRPKVYYTDAATRQMIEQLQPLVPNEFLRQMDATPDRSQVILRASSDTDAGTFFRYEPASGRFERIGSGYPALRGADIGQMRAIEYPARDGVRIPGYLTLPAGAPAHHLPLIVMPHGGPIDRDDWQFNFLRAFLVNRGYAVLQMNFRGSSGYGEQWLKAANQDWGGLSFADITDGARWAVAQGISDAGRMCIVGWSFGGYAALLGAVRNSDLYACAVSIAGVSDLSLLEAQESRLRGQEPTRAQIGAEVSKLAADSPARHARDVKVPVLLVHGDRDLQSDVAQSQAMDAALTAAGKSHEFLLLSGANHQIDRQADRVKVLQKVAQFLASHLPLAPPAP
jgi:dipeptidyl aminopeptidase/acylaminoacyl peptidase